MKVLPHAGLQTRVTARVCVMHLQTGGTRVPENDGAGAQAANSTPLQTKPLCAAPGCPQCLKTGSEEEKKDTCKRMGCTGRKRKSRREGIKGRKDRERRV